MKVSLYTPILDAFTRQEQKAHGFDNILEEIISSMEEAKTMLIEMARSYNHNYDFEKAPSPKRVYAIISNSSLPVEDYGRVYSLSETLNFGYRLISKYLDKRESNYKKAKCLVAYSYTT